ncbi:MAG TPA: hypothetical protein VFV67_15245 [Actinophytocola sp.]|uniref:hypothetical protein n=1 Tax=Actinophytocola sp. TaxID=1872138 RepID=UPI002DB67DB8|nr:hypothetical protein [Actinophytocola sp.]HEU5472006.1 hypothetical protein [Actinophytocola sp.]
MIYLLAVIGAIAVLVLLWRAFVARPASVAPPRKRSVAPDDDAEFLRDLERRRRRPEDDDGKPSS